MDTLAFFCEIREKVKRVSVTFVMRKTNFTSVGDNEISTLEGSTRHQANSEMLISESKNGFTTSNFYLISLEKRSNDSLAFLCTPNPLLQGMKDTVLPSSSSYLYAG